jgi:hypothetical protein
VELLAVAQGLAEALPVLAAEATEGAAEAESSGGLTVNLFWVIVAGANFAVFFLLAWKIVIEPLGGRLQERRERIEQGLKDAEATGPAQRGSSRGQRDRAARAEGRRRDP